MKLLLLHGNRQTHEIFSQRCGALLKKLRKSNWTFSDSFEAAVNGPLTIASPPNPSSPSSDGDDVPTRSWFNYSMDDADVALHALSSHWLSSGGYDGVLSFSQGSKLCHMIVAHPSRDELFPGLKFAILASGYRDPHPPSLPVPSPRSVALPSLHVIGLTDKLVAPSKSEDLAGDFVDPVIYRHDGGHHVPMKAKDLAVYLSFIESATERPDATPSPVPATSAATAVAQATTRPSSRPPTSSSRTPPHRTPLAAAAAAPPVPVPVPRPPDPPPPAPPAPASRPPPPPTAAPSSSDFQTMLDECESLACIYGEDFVLPSDLPTSAAQCALSPVVFRIKVFEYKGSDVSLSFKLPPKYPDECPKIGVCHHLNLLDFKSSQERALIEVAIGACMVCGTASPMSAVSAVKEWFEGDGLTRALAEVKASSLDGARGGGGGEEGLDDDDDDAVDDDDDLCKVPNASAFDAELSEQAFLDAELEGLEIAMAAPSLYRLASHNNRESAGDVASSGRGGQLRYVVGLVGKPSAGKSTYFNAATAFARQREGVEGAKMGAAPFTTIDPNVGFCFVPAPPLSCPEDDFLGSARRAADSPPQPFSFGCEHGRDKDGRRLIPVMLKDVAGLIPGAYQGRGKGNKFLDDLTDAVCLVHIVDASGLSDSNGNICEDQVMTKPFDEVYWIRREILMWISNNVCAKWHSVVRRGRSKLASLFTGYRQPSSVIDDILDLYESTSKGPSLADLDKWSKADVRRLCSLFLSMRFPTCLALNKKDKPNARENIEEAQRSLPLHGAKVGVGVSASTEMEFVRKACKIEEGDKGDGEKKEVAATTEETAAEAHRQEVCENNVWACLQQAITLCPPVLCFPVIDFDTLAPIPFLAEAASTVTSGSDPSKNHIASLLARGGNAPTPGALSTCVVMKPSSTVYDLYETLKHMHAITGMFVRAEGKGRVHGEKSRQLRKDEELSTNNRIIRIQTNKNRAHSGKSSC